MRERSEALKSLFAKRGTMRKIVDATGVKFCTVSNWAYIPSKHLKAVSKVTGIPQRDLPQKGTQS